MKKGILIVGITSLVALLSIPLSMDITYLALPNVYQETFYGGMKNKIDRLYETKQKKIVIIGGSSVPFSIDSSLIEKYLPEYKVVDFGLYASLGTNIMLDLAYDSIKKDDIVILSPEISSQTLSMYYNPLETHKALEQNKNMFFKLDYHMKQSMIASIPSFNGEKISYISKGITPIPKDIYAASSFNEYGDIKVNREGNIMLDGVDNNNPISIDTSIIETAFIDKMNEFSNAVKEKGATTYYRFSPMNEAAINYKDDLTTFYNYLHNNLNFEILGNPYNAVKEKEWFYDTNYHLNSSGVIMWSKGLINDIKMSLDITSPTDIPDVDKPPLINPDTGKEGDNTYLEYFEYLEKDDEVIITKLVKEEEKITIPYRYNSKVIAAFNPDVFQNKNVKEITIQDNIRLLYDNSFSDSSLTHLIIKNDKPNSIGVGDHLLDGSSASIYVSKDNLSAYQTSYNWAKYSTSIKEIS